MLRALVGLAVLLAGCKPNASFDEATSGKWSAAGKAWVQLFVEGGPGGMCEDGQYFRACFEVSKAECESAMRARIRGCIVAHPEVVPADVTSETGRVAGQSLGQCAGGAYFEAMVARGAYKRSPECEDAARWTAPPQ